MNQETAERIAGALERLADTMEFHYASVTREVEAVASAAIRELRKQPEIARVREWDR